jgi:hypothetical protein
MTHTPECITNMEKQEQDFHSRIQRETQRLEAAGIDSSQRGFGMSYKCICKETQQ